MNKYINISRISITNMKGQFVLCKGCLFLKINNKIDDCYLSNVPQDAKNNQIERDGLEYHITILSPKEMKDNDKENIKKYLYTETNIDIFGLGVNSGCYYLVCDCNLGNDIRKELKFSSKDFHITLGFDDKDNHEIRKNIRSIIIEDKNIIKNVINSLNNNDHKKNLNKLTELYERYSDDISVLYNYTKSLAIHKQYDSALMYANILADKKDCFAMAHFIIAKLKKYLNILSDEYVKEVISKLLVINEKHSLFELNNLLKIINTSIVTSKEIIKTKSLLSYDEKINIFELIELPWNFSVIDENVLGSGIIKEKHFSVLRGLGITKIINLMEEDKPTKEYINLAKTFGITICYFPITDRQDTTIEMINNIFNEFDTKGKILVHCLGGIGRTNMILACHLIKTKNISPSEAITILSGGRKVNLTVSQMMLVKNYYSFNSVKDESFKKVSLPNLIMLVGLPCSGKSTFSVEMQKYYSTITHINQDELGKKDCEDLFMNKMKGQNTIILDRCNLTKSDRKEWMTCVPSSKKSICIFFNIDLSVCINRVKTRENHPTIKNVAGGIKIIEDLSKIIEKPETKEGFSEIIIVNDENDLKNLKNKFGFGFTEISTIDTIMKFPRTKHLKNLGGMTRDDLLFDPKDLSEFLKIDLLVEEKIDGANLGLFLMDGKIMAQNRSHFVNSAYHTQFKSLDKWIDSHSIELYNIFDQGTFILF